MINVQPYIDKLDLLKKFISWKIDVPDKIAAVKVDNDRMMAFKLAHYATAKTMTFDQWLTMKTK